jgi:hypothetical protein
MFTFILQAMNNDDSSILSTEMSPQKGSSVDWSMPLLSPPVKTITTITKEYNDDSTCLPSPPLKEAVSIVETLQGQVAALMKEVEALKLKRELDETYMMDKYEEMLSLQEKNRSLQKENYDLKAMMVCVRNKMAESAQLVKKMRESYVEHISDIDAMTNDSNKKQKAFFFAGRQQISNEGKIMAERHQHLKNMKESYNKHISEIVMKTKDDNKKRKSY